MDRIIENKMMEQEKDINSQVNHVSNAVAKPSLLVVEEISMPTLQAVEFCSNILSRSGPQGKYLHILRFESYKHIAAPEIQCLLNSKHRLREMFSTFPLLFRVKGNKVSLRNWIIFHLNQQKWLNEILLNSDHPVPISASTIQFYCNELFKIAPGFGLTIHQLFSHRKKAPEAIQAVASTVNELILTLEMYPEIFHLKGDKVSLSKSALSYRSLETWVRRLLVSNFIIDKQINDEKTVAHCTLSDYDVMENEVAVYEAIGLYYTFILSDGSMKGILLQELLKKYNIEVPILTQINTIVDLKKFIGSYPEIFTLIDETVFLTQFYSYISQTDNEQTVISFYVNILNQISNLPDKITEFPIIHLFCYNETAPPEVKKMIKNSKELKNFLLKYPHIFKINHNDCIVFEIMSDTNENLSTSTNDSNINKKRVYEEVLKETVNYFTNIIYELGGNVKIEQLFDCRCQATEGVQSITTSFEDLKTFFCSQHNDFIVSYDRVSLKNKHKADDFEVNGHLNISEAKATTNAILFYSNVLRKHKSKIVSLIRMSGHRGSAPADVQSVAKNPKELKTFFSQFPEVFTIVNDNKVMLSKPDEKMINQQEQIFPAEIFCDHSEQDAVEYFSQMLSQYGLCRVLSVNKLFELKLQSSPTIQKISGSSIDNFLVFLKKYPQDFIVTNDNVIARKKIPKCSNSEKYENNKFSKSIKFLLFNFFKIYTTNRSLFHIDYLYYNAGRFFLYNDETPIFATKSDLLLFLGHFPHIFFVDYCRVVNVLASCREAFIYPVKRRKFKCEKPNQNTSKNKKTVISKPIGPISISPVDLDLKPLDVESKSSSDQIEEKNLNKTKTSDKYMEKYEHPTQKKKTVGSRAKEYRKNNFCSIVEPSFIEESIASGMCKNNDGEREAKFSSSCGIESDHFWNNECRKNNSEEEFTPPKIEELEESIFSLFIDKADKNLEDIKNPSTGEILNLNCSKEFFGREDFDVLVTPALIFINGKLWEEGSLKILNIEDLFNTFSGSGLEMKNYYCKNVNEFQNFLCKFPDQFIISKNNIMARKNKMEKVNYFLNKEEESLPILIFHFLNLYTEHYNFLPLKFLYNQIGKCFFNINRSPFFKSLGDLILFLEMFPDIFCIDNDKVINLTASKGNAPHEVKFKSDVIKIDSFLGKNLYPSVANEKCLSIPESTKGWKDCVLQRTQIVGDLSQCLVVTKDILNSQKVIALDCEGVNLGAAGILTLVQIGLVNGEVYIFDIIKETSMVNDGGLKDILESESILKVIHDSKNDVANLYTEYGVKITPIFDTRVAHHLIGNPKKMPNIITAIGFNELCSKYSANLNVEKDLMKNVYKCNPSFWMSRPLTKDMVAYAALDVASLIPIFFTMLKQLKGIPEKSLWELSGKHSLSVLNNNNLLFD